jgi:hypothetical protein
VEEAIPQCKARQAEKLNDFRAAAQRSGGAVHRKTGVVGGHRAGKVSPIGSAQ